MNDEQMKNLLQKNQPLPAELSEQQKTALLETTLQRLQIKRSPAVWIAIPTGILAVFLAYNVMINNSSIQSPVHISPPEYNALNSNTETLKNSDTLIASEDNDDDMAFEFPTLQVGEDFLTLADSNQMQ